MSASVILFYGVFYLVGANIHVLFRVGQTECETPCYHSSRVRRHESQVPKFTQLFLGAGDMDINRWLHEWSKGPSDDHPPTGQQADIGPSGSLVID